MIMILKKILREYVDGNAWFEVVHWGREGIGERKNLMKKKMVDQKQIPCESFCRSSSPKTLDQVPFYFVNSIEDQNTSHNTGGLYNKQK